MGDQNNAFMRNQDAAVQARTKAQNRATVLQLKLIGQSHPTGLTTNLLKLFEPRPPLEFKPPPEKRKCPSYTGLYYYFRARVHKLRLENGAKKAAEEFEKYDPTNDPNVSGDPYKTLFVARLNYETTEHRIKKEFEAYGPIKRVRMITDKTTSKPRGYAFIEYMHTRDMKTAYKQADGRKLDNRRVLVDVERGRTVPNWRPRRLGGGLGSTRVGGEEVNQKYSGREPQQAAAGGPTRSEEPRVREDRHVDREREKSRERGRDRDRDREREKSRERSHDRTRDREPREERHHRDRDRTRDRDRGREDRTRERDRGRDNDRDRDRDRGRDRGRDRHRERDRDERGESERGGHERSRDKEYDYDAVESKHGRERHADKDREYDPVEPESDHGYGYDLPEYGPYNHQGQDQHDQIEPQGERAPYDRDTERDPDGYDQMETEEYRYDRAASESREKERTRDGGYDYQRSDRSLSRDR
ncbi:hypothetical protein GIB67_005484 [Kingdonia uniflora]|uniref:RRM domain-containing protein n=1 Tax=Kingdonia uniflora TaxID=39325 RepID=A0A7J7NI25_9MAGN|nr:hypothetical protein GIB67_005484 [Kingdonia uniflora]